jgi:hypothetical protein
MSLFGVSSRSTLGQLVRRYVDAKSMKTLEFALTRAVRGCHLDQGFARPETAWTAAFHRLVEPRSSEP